MQVILLQRIEKLGFMGDVVTVKPGFARNYLLPQKKALRATKENILYFDQQKIHLEAENLKSKQDAEKVASKVADMALVMIRQAGDTGHLYGSVTTKDIAKVARDNGLEINSQQVKIARPIKEIGIHPVTVALHPEVSVSLFVNVAKSEEEAEAQWTHKEMSAAEVQAMLKKAEEAKEKGRAEAVEADASEASETEQE